MPSRATWIFRIAPIRPICPSGWTSPVAMKTSAPACRSRAGQSLAHAFVSPTLALADRLVAGIRHRQPCASSMSAAAAAICCADRSLGTARRGIAVHLTGIDLNPHAARAARELTPANMDIDWITGDAFSYTQPADVILSSLFTHHLPGAGDRPLPCLDGSGRTARLVHQRPRPRGDPVQLFTVLSKLARWHRFVRHDGPVSFRRSFREDDWRRMISAADDSADVDHAPALDSRPPLCRKIADVPQTESPRQAVYTGRPNQQRR